MSTSELVERIAAVRIADVAEELVVQVKRSMVDTLCLAIGTASDRPYSRMVLEYTRGQGGAPRVSVWGTSLRTGAPMAAFANGALAHGLDFDDMLRPMSAHPSPTILPGILAVAQDRGLSGAAVLEAYIAGVDVGARLGELLNVGLFRKGWHPTAVLGSLATAAATSRALSLSREATVGALGIASSYASGVRANFGTRIKGLHAGNAARNGVEAALLAEAGCRSHPDILERRFGFYNLFSEDGSGPNEVENRPGVASSFLHYGLEWKRYPCCGRIHPAVDAIRWLRRQHGFAPDDVVGITCGSYEVALHDLRFTRPRNGHEARYSMHYCLATAVEYDDIALIHMADDQLANPKVGALMDRIEFAMDPEPLETEAYESRITVTLRDGRVLSARARRRIGSGTRLVSEGAEVELPTTDAELERKWRGCLAAAGCHESALEPLLEAVADLERAPDIQRVIAALPIVE